MDTGAWRAAAHEVAQAAQLSDLTLSLSRLTEMRPPGTVQTGEIPWGLISRWRLFTRTGETWGEDTHTPRCCSGAGVNKMKETLSLLEQSGDSE